MEWQQENKGANADFLRSSGDGRGNWQQRGRIPVFDKVMFGQPDGVVPQFFGFDGEIEVFPIQFWK